MYSMRNIFASIVLCERALNEVDGVPSAIRIADVFMFRAHPQVPIEQQALPMYAVIAIRVIKDDQAEHSAQLKLIRPDGEESSANKDPIPIKTTKKFPDVPGGANLIIQLGIVPKQLGLHTFVLLFDGEEVAQTIFTVVQQEEKETTSSQTLPEVTAQTPV
jgi:hypothetical protein